ncbi:TatD family hydrolase [Bacillus cereus]
MSKLIDFHIHIDYYKEYKKLYDYFNNKQIYALFVTNLPEIYDKCRKEFCNSKYVKVALGYNPQLIKTHKFNENIFNNYLGSTKYIGEVGLDYSNEFISTKEEQKKIFKYICGKAGAMNKIISIHSRKAEEDTLAILRENNVRFAVFHWYTGKLTLIDEIINSGYYFSVNYSMLTSAKGKKIIERIPMDRLLIETDGPFGKCSKGNKREEYDLEFVYRNFEHYFNNVNIREIVFNNLSTLLVEQQKVNKI